MPPAVVYIESDLEVHAFRRRDDEWPTGGENWDEELLVPGRMVYVGHGQTQFLRIDEVDPGMMWPKRKKKKKKKGSSTPPPPPAPATLTPAPIDWEDWEELCQTAPPPLPTPSWEPEDWESEISPPWQPEDWEAEISPPWQPEDWEAEISPPWQPEDWEVEITPPWQPEDWDAEIASQ
jgi:hypothetical protein